MTEGPLTLEELHRRNEELHAIVTALALRVDELEMRVTARGF